MEANNNVSLRFSPVNLSAPTLHSGASLVPQKYIDHEFKEKFDESIHSLLQTMFAISGKHGIHSEKATQWVNAQKTPLKRRVARYFIQNTTYVTFREYFNGIGQLVKDNYEHITNGAQQIILYVSSSKKSYYFSAVIALHFIKKFHFRAPDVYVHTLFSENKADPILIFDDMSYSGSQMGDMLTKIYKSCVPTYTNDADAAIATPNIHILLYGLNSHSRRRLSEIKRVKIEGTVMKEYKHLKIPIKTTTCIDVTSPFPIHYVNEYKLLYELDVDMYHLVNFFFSPYLYGHPSLSIYFDHKIADDVSTYMKVLAFGPIIPGSYAISTFNTHMDEIETMFDVQAFKLTHSELSGKHTDEIAQLLQKYSDEDPVVPTDVTVEFAPFLEHCTLDPTFVEEVQPMTYNEFLFPEHLAETSTKKDLVHRSLVIHDDRYKCIQPFYKIYDNLDNLQVPLLSSSSTTRRHSIGGTNKNKNKTRRRQRKTPRTPRPQKKLKLGHSSINQPTNSIHHA